MQHHLDVARHHETIVDAESGIGHAAGPAQHHRHGGEGLEAGALVHEFELTRINRIHSKPDPERIDDALALAVAHWNIGRPMGHDPFVVQRHFNLEGQW